MNEILGSFRYYATWAIKNRKKIESEHEKSGNISAESVG